MSYDLARKQSMPRHPKDRSGVVLIVGTAPCVYTDLQNAMRSFKDYDSCAINDAAGLFGFEHIATCHPEKLDQFLNGVAQNESTEIHSRKKMKRPDRRFNEYVWDINIGGTSTLFAIAVMIAIGYQRIILCGCPMTGGDGYAIKLHEGTAEDPRLGDMDIDSEIIRDHQRKIREFKAENSLSDRVRSMSGVTKQIFGGL